MTGDELPINIRGLIASVVFAAVLIGAGSTYLRTESDERDIRAGLHGFLPIMGLFFGWVWTVFPGFRDIAGSFVCPPGHDVFFMFNEFPFCTGALGAFGVGAFGNVRMVVCLLVPFGVMVNLYLLCLLPWRWLARRLVQKSRVIALGISTAMLTLIFGLVLAFPTLLLPMAKPVNLLVNVGGVPSLVITENPLVNAAREPDTRAMTFPKLLNTVSNVDAPGKENTTALIAAVEAGQPGHANLLLKRGADPKLQDDNEKSAIDYAREQMGKGTPGYAELLEQMGGPLAELPGLR